MAKDKDKNACAHELLERYLNSSSEASVFEGNNGGVHWIAPNSLEFCAKCARHHRGIPPLPSVAWHRGHRATKTMVYAIS